jgi:hypothetical protein
MNFEVVQVGLGASMCCHRCGVIFKPGDETRIMQIPIPFRYGKQRKKAKEANTHIGLRVHNECEPEKKYSGFFEWK